jgi:hypothetical protein
MENTKDLMTEVYREMCGDILVLGNGGWPLIRTTLEQELEKEEPDIRLEETIRLLDIFYGNSPAWESCKKYRWKLAGAANQTS